MRYLTILLLLFCINYSALALSVKSINVDKRPNRIDILINFDSYFSDTLTRESSDNFQILIFPKVQGQQQSFTVNQFGITTIETMVIENNFILMLNGDKQNTITASQINKGSSYRIRITPLETTTQEQKSQQNTQVAQTAQENLPLVKELKEPIVAPIASKEQTQQGETNNSTNTQNSTFAFATAQGGPLQSIQTWQYVGVIAILIGLLLLLYYIKTKVNSSGNVLQFMNKGSNTGDHKITIINQVPIDVKHKLVVFEGYDMYYLVILGQDSATLVDKFPASAHTNFSQQFKSAKT